MPSHSLILTTSCQYFCLGCVVGDVPETPSRRLNVVCILHHDEAMRRAHLCFRRLEWDPDRYVISVHCSFLNSYPSSLSDGLSVKQEPMPNSPPSAAPQCQDPSASIPVSPTTSTQTTAHYDDNLHQFTVPQRSDSDNPEDITFLLTSSCH
jgi:hypothetical protein